jgi:glycosyltransferase involved in cell wall biosynthesis
MQEGMSKPHIAIAHYTALPIIGGVEFVIEQHTRLFANAAYPVTLIAGRGEPASNVVVVPEMDSEHPENLHVMRSLEQGLVPPEFNALQALIENSLAPILSASDLLIVHNVFHHHFNLPLTAALHHLIERGVARRVIAWCHDISRYVNPASGAQLRYGFPWDLLRACRPEITYVAVSSQRQRSLAEILQCPRDAIRVIPNGVDPSFLLGLSELGQHLVEEFKLLEADVIILMPIRITRAKNIEFGLRVTAALKASGVWPKLVVTGPPDPHVPDIQAYYHQLLALRYELDLDDQVIFVHEGTSHLPRPLDLSATDVAELYRVCDLVLMPSHREGFGIPVLEGGLVGRPVFATAMPVLEDIGAESVYAIGQDEPPALVAARIRWWMRDNPAHGLRRRVRQDYRWPIIFARSIQPLLRDCLGTGAA